MRQQLLGANDCCESVPGRVPVESRATCRAWFPSVSAVCHFPFKALPQFQAAVLGQNVLRKCVCGQGALVEAGLAG